MAQVRHIRWEMKRLGGAIMPIAMGYLLQFKFAAYPGARLWFDGDTGKLYGFYAPLGMAAGETITSWLFALHMASVGGLPYRIFVAVLGVVISALAVSGIWIWQRKRRPRTPGT